MYIETITIFKQPSRPSSSHPCHLTSPSLRCDTLFQLQQILFMILVPQHIATWQASPQIPPLIFLGTERKCAVSFQYILRKKKKSNEFGDVCQLNRIRGHEWHNGGAARTVEGHIR